MINYAALFQRPGAQGYDHSGINWQNRQPPAPMPQPMPGGYDHSGINWNQQAPPPPMPSQPQGGYDHSGINWNGQQAPLGQPLTQMVNPYTGQPMPRPARLPNFGGY